MHEPRAGKSEVWGERGGGQRKAGARARGCARARLTCAHTKRGSQAPGQHPGPVVFGREGRGDAGGVGLRFHRSRVASYVPGALATQNGCISCGGRGAR